MRSRFRSGPRPSFCSIRWAGAIVSNAAVLRSAQQRSVAVVNRGQKTTSGLADSFAEGPDGTIFVTSTRIQHSTWFKPEQGTVLSAPGESAPERIHLGPDLQRQGTGQGSVA